VKPEGAIVTITYDANPDQGVVAGDALVTTTGRLYLILGAERVATAAVHLRLRLRCVVAGKVAAPQGVTVHPLYWNVRRRSRA
jgi:hypothetical protein